MASVPKNINEEAGLGPNWVPLDGPPLVPGQTVAAPPASDMIPISPRYFQGSVAPNFQHDSDFTKTPTVSSNSPKFDLMPLGPQQNAISATQITSTVISTQSSIPSSPTTPVVTDDDVIRLNLQQGTSYTVQLSDLNKLISFSNNSGGSIFLPPVAVSTTVAITNSVDNPFNSGNTVVSGSNPATATSTFVFTANKAIAVGDFLFLAIRNVSNHLDVPVVAMNDSVNGPWNKFTIDIDDAVAGVDTLTLFWIRNKGKINAGGNLTLTFVATYPTSGFNPQENEFWSMTGLTASDSVNSSSGLSSGSTISSGGLTISKVSTFISVADSNNGDLAAQTPANSQGAAWIKIGSGGSPAARFNYLPNITSGFVNDVYTLSVSGHGFIDIMKEFDQATVLDTNSLTNFFCYVENTGTGSFSLLSAAPIDGSNAPVVLGSNQGTLLVWDTASQSWYTERGMGGGGTDTDFYQTVQQSGISQPQESKLNFLSPVTAVDNAGNGSTDITVPDMVGDSGSGGVHGLVPAPAAGDAAAGKFLKASGAFATPPTMVGDSGSGGTSGYVPAPPAGSNAAGDFLSAGGAWVNPGSNPASFNTGLVYAIAAGYALG